MAIYESHVVLSCENKEKIQKAIFHLAHPVDFYHRVDEGDSPRYAEWIWYNSSVLLD